MPRLAVWLGASAADAGLRLAAQILSTIVVARLLAPEDFGLATLTLTVVAVLGAAIGLPFEESLAQRRRIRTAHLQAALCVSLVLTALAVGLAFALAGPLARLAEAPGLAVWLPVAALFLVAEGPGAVARALARRYGRYVELSACQSASAVLGAAAAVWVALATQSVAALLLQRLLPGLLFALFAAMAARRRGGRVLVAPRWHAARFGELFRFSWLHLADVGVGAATPAAVAFVVNAVFGAATLGQLNVAMRLVEPLRQLIGGVGHNLVVSRLARLQDDPVRLCREAGSVVVHVGALAVPAFFGIAVCAPILLPLLVGPGWDEAVPLTRALCLAAALYVPFGFLYSGYSALGRPEYGLLGSVLRLVAAVVGLEILRWGTLGIGLAMILAEAVTAAVAIVALVRIVGAAAWSPLLRSLGIWVAAALMAAALHLLYLRGPAIAAPVPLLAALIATGALLYPLLLLGVCRDCLAGLRAAILARAEGRP